jgi:hypothetical protein
MKTTFFTILLVAITSFSSFGQTKMIAHKSHSGNRSNWLQNFHADDRPDDGNFGVGPTREVRYAKLDTLKVIRPNVVVMVTSNVCMDGEFDRGDRKENQHLWRAGRDTLYNHPYFNTDKTVKEMKESISTRFYFANSAASVAFIGYEQAKDSITDDTKSNAKQELKDVKHQDRNIDTNKRQRPSLFMMLLMVIKAFFKHPIR